MKKPNQTYIKKLRQNVYLAYAEHKNFKVTKTFYEGKWLKIQTNQLLKTHA